MVVKKEPKADVKQKELYIEVENEKTEQKTLHFTMIIWNSTQEF